MPRWTKEDTDNIAELRERCADLLREQAAFPEVVGDRRILRFIKGHPESLDKAVEMYTKFLKWRKEMLVDEMRTNILSDMDHPTKFPGAETILRMIPTISIAFNAKDKHGAPICVDQYDFNPTEILANIQLGDYIKFATYSLEYKSIILDQMAEEKERAWLANLSEEDRNLALDPYDTKITGHDAEGDVEKGGWGYQFTCYTCVVRDMGAVGWKHLGEEGRRIIKAVIGLASDNYPELLRKCIMINVPWLFNSTWPLIRSFLAAQTVKKISIVGSRYKEALHAEIEEENVPEMVNGPYKGGVAYEAYGWDLEWLNTPFVPRVDYSNRGGSESNWHSKDSIDYGAVAGTTATAGESDSSLPSPPGDAGSDGTTDSGDNKPPAVPTNTAEVGKGGTTSPSVLQSLGHA